MDIKWRPFNPSEYDRIGLQVHCEFRRKIDPNKDLFGKGDYWKAVKVDPADL